MIRRTYMCADCGHVLEVTLTMRQANKGPPDCPACAGETRQEFKPIAIGGSARARAVRLAEEIAEKDYGVADMNPTGKEGATAGARYKDQTANLQPSSFMPSNWGTSPEVLQGAIAAGREVRLKHGSGLDVLQSALRDGSQPDLIELSKKRSMKVW